MEADDLPVGRLGVDGAELVVGRGGTLPPPDRCCVLAIYAFPPNGTVDPETSLTWKACGRLSARPKCGNFQSSFRARSGARGRASSCLSSNDVRCCSQSPRVSLAATSAPQCADQVGPL